MSTNLDLFLLCAGASEVVPLISAAALFAAGLFVVTLTIAANGIIDGYLSRVVGAPPGSMRALVVVFGLVLGSLIMMLSPFAVVMAFPLCE